MGPPTCPLHPVNPSNARHLRITAAAGTELAVAFSRGTVKLRPLFAGAAFVPRNSGLRPEGLHPARGVAWSGFRPLPNILDCSLP